MKCRTAAAIVIVYVFCFQICDSNLRNSSCQFHEQGVCTVRVEDTSEIFIKKEFSWTEQLGKHLDFLKTYLQVLQRKYEKFSNITAEIDSKQEYLGNVMNTFSLLKRSATDWKLVIKTVHTLPGSFNPNRRNAFYNRVYNDFAQGELILQKSAKVISGVRALSRLQNIYHITADTLANAKLEGALRHTKLTAQDCLDIALFYSKKPDYLHYTEWLEETLKKINDGDGSGVLRKDVLEQYFRAKCVLGDVAASTSIFKKLLAEFPDFSSSETLLRCKLNETEKYREIIRNKRQEEGFDQLEICNRRSVSAATEKYLRCRYVHYNKRHLMVGPFKVEEYHLDPPVLLFHQVISDAEIDEMIAYAKPTMELAKVYGESGNVGDESSRNSYWRWIDDDELPTAARLSQKVSQISGLDLYKAETNQLNSYGLAGEFRPHIDAVFEQSPPKFADFAIVMFYLSNVGIGGHTIFPAVNVSVTPTKGSAILWFNRNAEGNPELKSLHAGCPVVQGSKWMLVSLFHSYQDFPKCTKERRSSFKYFYL